jgi:hypothetical protein
MKTILLAAVASLALTAAVHARDALASPTVQITAFGQTSGANTTTATVNATDTQTTITITDANLLLSQLLGQVTPLSADLDLTATSIDAVQGVGQALLQHYSGSFCITSGPGCSGVDFLSGTFSDAAFGLATGSQLSVNVSNPPDSLSLVSSVIPSSELAAPSSITFAFSNVSPGLSQLGTTIAPFTASVAGDADASVVPEPASLALFLVGLVGLTALRFRRSL